MCIVTEINELKAKNETLIAETEVLKKSLQLKFEQFMFSSAFKDGFIGFDQMADKPLGEDFELPSTIGSEIITRRIPCSGEDCLYFETSFKGHSILYSHIHKDCNEEIEVVSDSVFRVITGREKDTRIVTLTKGSKIFIPAGVLHQVSNESGIGIIKVFFTRKK